MRPQDNFSRLGSLPRRFFCSATLRVAPSRRGASCHIVARRSASQTPQNKNRLTLSARRLRLTTELHRLSRQLFPPQEFRDVSSSSHSLRIAGLSVFFRQRKLHVRPNSVARAHRSTHPEKRQRSCRTSVERCGISAACFPSFDGCDSYRCG